LTENYTNRNGSRKMLSSIKSMIIIVSMFDTSDSEFKRIEAINK